MRCLALVLAAGCASTADGDGVIAQGECILDVEVTGSFPWSTASLSGASLECSEPNTDPFGERLTVTTLAEGVRRGIHLDFSPPLEPSETGIKAVTIVVFVESDALTEWRSATNACQFEVIRNTVFDPNNFVIGGVGTCGDSLLQAQAPSQQGPVGVGLFELRTLELLP